MQIFGGDVGALGLGGGVAAVGVRQVVSGAEGTQFAGAEAPEVVTARGVVERGVGNTPAINVRGDARTLVAKFTPDEVEQVLRGEGGAVLRQEARGKIDFNVDFHGEFSRVR